jgi:hypothetical protein
MYRKGLLAAAAISLLCATAAMADSTTSGSGPAPGKSWHRHFVHMRDPASAKDMCIEHFARSAGKLAYLEARLQLTTDQQPLWNKWAEATSAGNATMRDDCVAAVPRKNASNSALDRDSTIEKLLSDKLDALKTARPALEALYQSLTPEQRVAFDRGTQLGHGMGGHKWHHHDQDGGQGREMSPT